MFSNPCFGCGTSMSENPKAGSINNLSEAELLISNSLKHSLSNYYTLLLFYVLSKICKIVYGYLFNIYMELYLFSKIYYLCNSLKTYGRVFTVSDTWYQTNGDTS